jgi:hypothetical protein
MRALRVILKAEPSEEAGDCCWFAKKALKRVVKMAERGVGRDGNRGGRKRATAGGGMVGGALNL